MPSTVNTSTTTYATRASFQRKSFYANGRFWVFYSNGTNMVYRTSTDAENWSSENVVTSCDRGFKFSVWFDGTYLHYACSSAEASAAIWYRRGFPESNGTITWSTADEQIAVGASASYEYHFPTIAVDSGGYPWIGYSRYYIAGAYFYCYVTKASTNNGTWTTATNFPYRLTDTTNDGCSVIPTPLTAQKVFVFYCYYSTNIYSKGKLWTGSWGLEESVTITEVQMSGGEIRISAVNEGDNIHLVFLQKASPYNILYRKRTYATGWGSEETVQSSTTLTSAPVLSINTVNNDLYCFWAGSPTTDHIYYRKYDAGTSQWGSLIDWITETIILTGNDRLTCFYKDNEFRLGLMYMRKTSSPFEIRFGFLFTLATGEVSLSSTFNVQQASSKRLSSVFFVFHVASRSVSSKFVITKSGFRQLSSKFFVLIWLGSKSLSSKVTIQQSKSKGLSSKLFVGGAASKVMSAKFFVYPSGYRVLSCKFVLLKPVPLWLRPE